VTTSIFQIILIVLIAAWAVISIIMMLEGENQGERATDSFDWIKKYSPAWYRKVSVFIVLPLFVVLLLLHHFGI
jgi:cytochrome b subunit of formate dehydrogenase